MMVAFSLDFVIIFMYQSKRIIRTWTNTLSSLNLQMAERSRVASFLSRTIVDSSESVKGCMRSIKTKSLTSRSAVIPNMAILLFAVPNMAKFVDGDLLCL